MNSNDYFKLSAQRALLGNITNNIRAISALLEGDNITLKFFYDGIISEDDEENASIVETEIIADLDDSSVVHTVVTRLDYPEPIKSNGILLYLRKEQTLDPSLSSGILLYKSVSYPSVASMMINFPGPVTTSIF